MCVCVCVCVCIIKPVLCALRKTALNNQGSSVCVYVYYQTCAVCLEEDCSEQPRFFCVCVCVCVCVYYQTCAVCVCVCVFSNLCCVP